MRGYNSLTEALAAADKTGAVGIMVDTEWIRANLARIAAMESALVEERAKVLSYEGDGVLQEWDELPPDEQEVYRHHARGILATL